MTTRRTLALLLSLTAATATLGTAALAAPAAAAASCTDSWQGPTTGVQSWSVAANWTAGVPGSSSDVCIVKAGTYTVDLSAGTTVSTLNLGGSSGTQTLVVDGGATSVGLSLAAAATDTVDAHGVLRLQATPSGFALLGGVDGTVVQNAGVLSTSGGGQPVYLRTAVANLAAGTASFAAADMRQDSGTLTSNAGAFTVAAGASLALNGNSSFTNSAGTLAVPGALAEASGTFTASGGALTGNPVVLTGGTLADGPVTGAFDVRGSTTLSGPIPTGQTVTVDGAATSVQLVLAGATTVAGSLDLLATDNGFAMLGGSGALTLAAGGTLTTAGSGQPAYLRVPITNQAGTVTIGTPDTRQDSGTLTSNAASFAVGAGAGLALSSSSSFTNAAGSLTVGGSFQQSSGTFTASGGTEAGQPVVLTGGTLADSAGTGAFDVRGSTTLSGSIPSGQTVTVDGASTSVQLVLAGATTVRGTLALTPSPSGYAMVTGGGSLKIPAHGVLTTSGSGQPVYLRVPITNQAGTVTIGTPDTRQDSGTLTSNAASFAVGAGAGLALSSSSSFTNAAGSLTVGGSFQQSSGTFTASGGTEAGQPVVLTGGTLADSAGTGAFDVRGSTTLSGSIPSGQTVTVDGADTSVQLVLPGSTPVSGHLALTPTGNGFAMLGGSGSLTVASGGAFTTSGGGQPTYLRVPITVDAGGSAAIGTAVTTVDSGTGITDSGRFAVSDGAQVTLSSGSTFTATAAGTLGVTVNGTTGVASGLAGASVSLAGALAVTTVGSAPAVGTVFTPVGGPATGTFSSFAFGPSGYGVSYPSGAVVLTTTGVFTVAATPFAPHQAIATGTVQVAMIGAAGNGTGTYSATVDWGDATAPTAATVAVTGSTGTVTSAGHTYARAGTFTVTTTVANSNGTVIAASVAVVVPVLAVSHVAPSSGSTHGGTAVTITGSGFTGATAVHFGPGAAGTSLTVVSDTRITVVSPAHGAGRVDVVVTTPAGTSKAVRADGFTYQLPPPAVASVAPLKGPAAGGNTVTITGSGFTGATAVAFGATAAAGFTVVSDSRITVVVPAHAPGEVDVRVTTGVATSAVTGRDHYTYRAPVPVVTGVAPSSGPVAGGTTVTITGTGFTGTTSVRFDGIAATGVTAVSDTQVTAVSPAGVAGRVDIRVTTAGGTSAGTTADRFHYGP